MKLGLIGQNISYSLSPFIHRFLLTHLQLPGSYDLIDLETLDTFPNILSNYDGLNITIPYKSSILERLPQASLDPLVAQVKATNCLHISGNTIACYNTDGYGFLQPLYTIEGFTPKQILILGAGGAMKAIYATLQEAYPEAQITIASRRPSNQYISYTDLENQDTHIYDLIINTTPVNPFHFTSLKEDVILYDLNYRLEKCHFLHAHPNTTQINGIGMLVYQAVKSFELWHSISIDREIVQNLFTEIEVQYGIKQ